MRRVILPYPPQDREQLWWTVQALFGITIPRTRICPDHCSPFDAFADAYFRDCTLPGFEGPISRAIWHASRGLAGKSYTLATLGLYYAYVIGADITILGGSLAQSNNVHEYMVKAMEFEGIPETMTVDQTATKTRLSNNGRVRPLPASQRNVRGPHPSILLCVAGSTLVPTPAGSVRIDELREGHTIGVSFDGITSAWDDVLRVIDQGEKPTVIVTLSNGTELTCTPEHRIHTQWGWAEAERLIHHDVLTAWADPDPVSRLDGVAVVGLRPGPPTRCWDVTTSAHTFFADGVLVHNCDEADEMELDIYDAALGQPLPQKNYLAETVDTFTVVSSTWQNPDGTFTEILRRAEEKHQPVYKWCYKESANPVDGWLTQKTIAEKIDSVSAEMFRVEYDLGEPTIGNRAFDAEAIEKTFSVKFAPADVAGEGKGYIEHKVAKDLEEYRFARRVNAGVYVAGADWAKEQDKTVIWVARIDGRQRELVYFLRLNRRPYPMMIGYLNKAIGYYRVPLKGVWHDSTGLGNVVNDYLDVRAKPFPMTGDKRAILLSDYVNAVEKGMWKIPRITSTFLEHKYCSTGDLYSHGKTFHLPDTVCAAALAEYAAKRFTGSAGPVVIARSTAPTPLEKQFNADESPARRELEPDPGPTFDLVV